MKVEHLEWAELSDGSKALLILSREEDRIPALREMRFFNPAVTAPSRAECRRLLDAEIDRVCREQGLSAVDSMVREPGRDDPNETKARTR